MDQDPKSTKISLGPPCCLQFSPTDGSVLLAGTYTLHKENGTRTGSIERYELQTGELILTEEVKVESAILDLKFIDPTRFITAQSTGNIMLWNLGKNIELLRNVQIFEEDVLVTSITIGDDQLGITSTTGSVATVSRETLQVTQIYESIHSLECWCLNFNEGVIYSGGDDAKLNLIDPRIGMVTRSLRHDAGVTSILPWKGSLLSGSYDDNIRRIDISSFREVEKHNLGGGVWRLTPQGDELLVNCMYDGAKILNSDLEVTKILSKNHTSICYGGAWKDDSLATCSFYDKVIQLW
ncbi:unnamed protein product [Kuraishia capsulata CBS 1993]|uniref:methylated diphthine methylhydrolase n=1 Tax=Kuraishia capsulata CBS 1993 TaxID=1382522 RepID=W6MFX1_9ASCO|nr:uncharacterized protein KUCA_T00000273001 [Kuraishia capsulata CBS 1993]CDK24313.1 unnamed protein product [Kuraishia capsulata CBS 1993]